LFIITDKRPEREVGCVLGRRGEGRREEEREVREGGS